MRKYLSFIIVPHDDSKMRNYRVSYALVGTFITLVMLSIITLVFFVFTYGRILLRAHQANILSYENGQLKRRNAQIDSLRTELVRMTTMGIQIKHMLGVDLSYDDSVLVANWSPAANSPTVSQLTDAAEAGNDEQQQLLRAIPSLWPVQGWVSRDFFVTGGEANASYHPGMDIAAKRNTPIKTSAEGVVTESGWDEIYGNYVVIDHGFGIQSLYGHNNRNLVNIGERVARGQTVAFVGNTGKSTAPHLHFEVRKNGVAVDPRNYLLN